MPSRSALGALPRTGAGEARERGRCPLGHVAGLWPACGRDARAPRGWPWERCSWERGHLARIGPKARKAPTEATPPSRPPPRRRRPMPSRRPWVHCRGRPLEKPASVGVARLAMWRACGPLAGGTPALPGCGPVSDVPGSAGILPASGRRPAKRRQKRHARAGHPPAGGAQCRRGRPWVHCRGLALEKPASVASPAWPCGGPVARLRAGRPRSQGVALGAMFLGARASCPHRAEGPQSADRSDTPEPATPRARGAQCRRGRPWVHCRGRALEWRRWSSSLRQEAGEHRRSWFLRHRCRAGDRRAGRGHPLDRLGRSARAGLPSSISMRAWPARHRGRDGRPGRRRR